MSFLNEGDLAYRDCSLPKYDHSHGKREGEGRSLHPQALSEGSPLPAGLLSEEALPGLEPCSPAPSVQCSQDWLWSWKGSFHHFHDEEEGSIITLVGREEKPFPAPRPPPCLVAGSGGRVFSRVRFPVPWPSPDLGSVSSKQKRACFMPSQIK